MTDTAPPPFLFHQGTAPLLISMPHVGTYVPPALAARFTDEARQVHDTDWHLERLYGFAKDLGASILVATHSRYVVDLNRPPDGASLYPGQSVTGLCPVDTFDDTPIYAAGDVPGDAEVAARRDAVWAPYHAQLRAELDRIHAALPRRLLNDFFRRVVIIIKVYGNGTVTFLSKLQPVRMMVNDKDLFSP